MIIPYVKKHALYIAWMIALLATAGSLSFQYLMNLPPCVLCWYQRIFMYPILAILTIGIMRKDRGVTAYVMPLSIIGGIIAAYHVLLYYHVIPDTLAPCTTGVSCTVRLIEWFGFLTIPLMSFLGFLAITILMIVQYYSYNQTHDERN